MTQFYLCIYLLKNEKDIVVWCIHEHLVIHKKIKQFKFLPAWINKLQYIHLKEYHLTIKWNGLLKINNINQIQKTL